MKTNRALQANWPLILLFGSYTCYALWALCFGERIPVRGGLGWDGEIYYFISQDFFQYWKGRGFDGYYIQRIVPSLIVKGMHYVMGTEHAYWRTGTYFGLLNLASMLGGTGFLLFALKSVSQKWKWMAALMALISFGTLKHPYYYPILTDSFAFLLGAFMLWAHISEKRGFVVLAAIVGAFTFPSFLLMALPLIVFSKQSIVHHPKHALDKVVVFAVLLTLTALAFLGPAFNGTMLFGTMQPSKIMVLLAIPFLLGYVFVLWTNIGIISRLKYSFYSVNAWGLVIWVLLFLVMTLVKYWAKPAPFGLWHVATSTVASALVHPGVALVAHATYFGPVFLLFILYWKRLKQTLLEMPLPLFWSTFLSLTLLMGSESRALIAGLPFIIFVMVMTLRQLQLNSWQQVSFLLLAIAFSQVWLPINNGEMSGEFLQFPMQRYFMHFGPWMSNTSYVLNLILVVTAGVAVWAIFRKSAVN